MDFPHILHNGAISGVTGPCNQLLMDAVKSLLVDRGLFQGAEISPDETRGAGRLTIDSHLDGISALVDTDVHIDRVGGIPYLLAAGFKGPIICSRLSAKLLPIVLEDAFKLGVGCDQARLPPGRQFHPDLLGTGPLLGCRSALAAEKRPQPTGIS